MLNRTGIKTESAVAVNQILANTQFQVSFSVIVGNAGITADAQGRKILKAGTPISGNLEARGTAFVKETTTTNVSNANAVLLHDVDVTSGNANGTALVFGFVNLSKVDSATQALITNDVKTALKAKVTFVK